MKEKEMARVAEIIDVALSESKDPAAMDRVAVKVRDLAGSFPLYPELQKGYYF